MEKTLERVEKKLDDRPGRTEVERLGARVDRMEAALGHFANPDTVRKFLEDWDRVKGLLVLASYRRWLWGAIVGGLGLVVIGGGTLLIDTIRLWSGR